MATLSPLEQIGARTFSGKGALATTTPIISCRLRLSPAPDTGDREYALYQIHIGLPDGVGWSVFRRYSDFDNLERELEPMLGAAERELFPPKHRLASSKDSSVVQERLERLPQWLIAVSRHASASTHPSFREFLDLHQHEEQIRAAMGAALPAHAPVIVHLEAGHLQPGAKQEIAEVTLPGPLHDVMGTAFAPPHAGDEVATATSVVDVRLPRVDTRGAKAALKLANAATDETLATEVRANDLSIAADDAERKAVSEAAAAQVAVEEASSLQAHITDAERQQLYMANQAALLEAEARRHREEAERLATGRARDAVTLHRLEKDADARMREHTASVERAAQLKELARTTHEHALETKRAALEAHQHAADEVVAAEQQMKAAADREEHRQVAAAAAAAATTKRNMTHAAMLKATEEAALSQARLEAETEAEATAQLALARERLERARVAKHDAQVEADAAQRASKAFTEAAAKSAADVDAHSNAANAVRKQAQKAEAIVEEATEEAHLARSMLHEDAARADTTATEMRTTTMITTLADDAPVPSANLDDFVAGKPVVSRRAAGLYV